MDMNKQKTLFKSNSSNLYSQQQYTSLQGKNNLYSSKENHLYTILLQFSEG